MDAMRLLRLCAAPDIIDLLNATITAEEKTRLAALARDWPGDPDDIPRDRVLACLDRR
jgi:hypothetical protein